MKILGMKIRWLRKKVQIGLEGLKKKRMEFTMKRQLKRGDEKYVSEERSKKSYETDSNQHRGDQKSPKKCSGESKDKNKTKKQEKDNKKIFSGKTSAETGE
ncbi:MAG: hypothetical protein ACI4C1_01895 [Lachnospiraceae bacterium]